MMRSGFLFILILFVADGALARHSPDSLLLRLDAAIGNHEKYAQEKKKRIRQLTARLSAVPPDTPAEYDLNAALFDEYSAYICDSAIVYQNRNIDIAGFLNDTDRLYESKLKLSYLMSSAGMYKESVDMIHTIDKDKLPARLQVAWYRTYAHVHSELAYYTQDNRGAQYYREIANQYFDSLYKILTPDDELYYEMKESDLRYSGHWDEALAINDMILAKHTPGTREYAIARYNRSLTYRQAGDTEGLKNNLILSALSDIMSATKDHASLWMLAEILYNENDMSRAYNYIRFSWDETVFYNARLRSLQSAVILSLIDKTYQAKIEMQNDQLQRYLILISILVVLLAVAFFYIYRQMKRLSVIRKYLQEANLHLQQLNEALSESNHVKEEYIGHFIKLCSTYVDKLDALRRMVNKKIAAGKTADLLRLTGSREGIDSEIEELYVNFDKAFLRIFPDFVEKANNLLNEDGKIVLKRGELLNTELRILALIRLGISNSSQIADFLRYSVNTIYNYRAKVKNRALSRDDFEELIAHIR
jgi:DNA-binding CsgD family transcriptional regulator